MFKFYITHTRYRLETFKGKIVILLYLVGWLFFNMIPLIINSFNIELDIEKQEIIFKVLFCFSLILNSIVYAASWFNFNKKDSIILIISSKWSKKDILKLNIMNTFLLIIIFYILPLISYSLFGVFKDLDIFVKIFLPILLIVFMVTYMFFQIWRDLYILKRSTKKGVLILLNLWLFIVSLLFIPSSTILSGWPWTKYFIYSSPLGWVNRIIVLNKMSSTETIILSLGFLIFCTLIITTLQVSIKKIHLMKGNIC